MAKAKQMWTLADAIKYMESKGITTSRPTLIKWAEKYDMGYQLGGRGGKWYIKPEKFQRFINGGNNNNGKTDDPTKSIFSGDIPSAVGCTDEEESQKE